MAVCANGELTGIDGAERDGTGANAYQNHVQTLLSVRPPAVVPRPTASCMSSAAMSRPMSAVQSTWCVHMPRNELEAEEEHSSFLAGFPPRTGAPRGSVEFDEFYVGNGDADEARRMRLGLRILQLAAYLLCVSSLSRRSFSTTQGVHDFKCFCVRERRRGTPTARRCACAIDTLVRRFFAELWAFSLRPLVA